MTAALTITAVNAATDQLTIVGHGRATGDGVAALFNPANTLPGGTLPLHDYWIIVDDVDHVRLATSLANALASTAVDITTAGVGQHYLLIGMPYRVQTQYAPGSQVKSVDLVALQQSFVDLWSYFTGQAPQATFFTGITLPQHQNVQISGTGVYKHGEFEVSLLCALQCVPGGAGVSIVNGAAVSVIVNDGNPVTFHLQPFLVGKRLKRIKFTAAGAGASTAPTLVVRRLDSDGSIGTTYATTNTLLGAVTGAHEYTIALDVPAVLGEGSHQMLTVTPHGASTTFHTISAIFEHP